MSPFRGDGRWTLRRNRHREPSPIPHEAASGACPCALPRLALERHVLMRMGMVHGSTSLVRGLPGPAEVPCLSPVLLLRDTQSPLLEHNSSEGEIFFVFLRCSSSCQ